MVYKFRSLKEADLVLPIKDIDGDQHTVHFEKIQYPGQAAVGVYETEEVKIAEAMLKDSRNGVVYMDADYVNRLKREPLPEPVVETKKAAPKARKTQPISKKHKSKKQ